MNNAQWLDEVKFNEQGLVPAIAQHHQTGRVLMVAWMNREALALTAEKNQAVYFSRSRSKLWHKGEESGHFQTVHEIRLDCDADVIVLQIEQHGGIACHTGRESCFYRKLTPNGWEIVDAQLKFMVKNPQIRIRWRWKRQAPSLNRSKSCPIWAR